MIDDSKDRAGCVLDQLLDEAGFGWFQVRLCLLCSMGYFAVGSELLTMVMTQSGVMSAFSLKTSLEFSWLPFFANLASFIAAICIGKIIDKFGRKLAFIGCIAVSAVFALICSLSPSFEWLIFFRSIVGFGLGGIAVIDYVVLVECCPEAYRTTASQIVFVSGCLGVIYVAFIGMLPLGAWFPNIDFWRSVMFLGGLPLIATVVLRALISTDTPKFLVATGKIEQGYQLLCAIAKTNRTNAPMSINESEFATRIEVENLSTAQANRGRVSDVLKVAATLPLALVWVVQSLVYWGLTTFLPVFLTHAGVSPNIGLMSMGLAELPGVMVGIMVSRKWGRPVALMVSLSLSAVGAVITGTAVLTESTPELTCFGASLFYMFLVPVWGILFVITPETYPVAIRGVATGFHHMCKSVPSLFAPFIAAALLDSGLEGAFMYIWAGVLGFGVGMSSWLHGLCKASH